VRDNVYSIPLSGGLALAYRKVDEDKGRTFELRTQRQADVRGLLFADAPHKVEQFKHYSVANRMPLHAKYNTQTADIVVGDGEWGHFTS